MGIRTVKIGLIILRAVKLVQSENYQYQFDNYPNEIEDNHLRSFLRKIK